MENQENLSTPYADPNAYIQHCNPPKKTKKIVFQEPYENMPNFYIDNNFKKGSCSCIPKPKPKPKPNGCKTGLCYPREYPPKPNYHCNSDCNSDFNHNENPNFNNPPNDNQHQSGGYNFPFNMKNILSFLGGNEVSGLANLFSLFGGGNSASKNSTPQISGVGDLIKSFTSNGDFQNLLKNFTGSGGLSSLLNLFKKPSENSSGGGRKSNISSPKSTDFCIKDYVRVE